MSLNIVSLSNPHTHKHAFTNKHIFTWQFISCIHFYILDIILNSNLILFFYLFGDHRGNFLYTFHHFGLSRCFDFVMSPDAAITTSIKNWQFTKKVFHPFWPLQAKHVWFGNIILIGNIVFMSLTSILLVCKFPLTNKSQILNYIILQEVTLFLWEANTKFFFVVFFFFGSLVISLQNIPSWEIIFQSK